MSNKNNQTNHADYIPPDGAIESLVRCLLPGIQAYYESEEGRREFAEWKKEKNASKK